MDTENKAELEIEENSSAFSLLSLEPSIDLDLEALKSSFQEASQCHHPDQGGSLDAFEKINQAYQALKQKPTRLIEILKHFEVSFEARGSISPQVENLFKEVGELIQKAEPVLKQKEQTSTPLALALIENQVLEIQQEISAKIQDLNQKEALIFNELLKNEDEIDVELIQETTRSLLFIQKWRAQLQSCFARCW